MENSTAKEAKVSPVWTNTVSGVEISIYRNVIKGRQLPVYKVSRKKWFKSNDGLKSNNTLDMGDWAIARSLESDAWRDISKMTREERAAIKAANGAAEPSIASSEQIVE